jgi:hypothetical protein
MSGNWFTWFGILCFLPLWRPVIMSRIRMSFEGETREFLILVAEWALKSGLVLTYSYVIAYDWLRTNAWSKITRGTRQTPLNLIILASSTPLWRPPLRAFIRRIYPALSLVFGIMGLQPLSVSARQSVRSLVKSILFIPFSFLTPLPGICVYLYI